MVAKKNKKKNKKKTKKKSCSTTHTTLPDVGEDNLALLISKSCGQLIGQGPIPHKIDKHLLFYI